MRLMVLTTSYPLTADSSAGIFVARLLAGMPATVSSTVVTPAARTSNSTTNSDRIAVRPFRYAPRRLQVLAQEPGGIPVALREHKWVLLLLPSFLLSMLASCLRYSRAADVIHANWAICGCIAGFAGKLLGVPVVTTLRGEDVTRSQHRIFDRMILSLCMRLSDQIVTVSRSIDTWLQDQYPRYKKKICMIENGVDNVFLAPSTTRNTSQQKPQLRLITVGSLIPRKGVEQIIHAMQRLPQPNRVSLTIIGDGPEKDRLVELVKNVGLHDSVRLAGALPPHLVAQELATADVFVLASHSEGRPNAVLEAMAAALPVIASNIPGTNELVEDGNTGLLFPPGSIDRLADHIRALLTNPDLRDRFGQAGRSAILRRQLHWERTAERYCRIYRELMDNKRPCAES